MKKGFSFVLAALLAGGALALLAGCGGSSSGKSGETAGGGAKEFDIIYLTPSTASQFWSQVEIGIKNAMYDLQDSAGVKINYSVVGPAEESQTEEYVTAFERAIAALPDAIVTAVIVVDAALPKAREATANGIVLNFVNVGVGVGDDGAHEETYNQFYYCSNDTIGELAAQAFLAAMEKKGMDPAQGGIVGINAHYETEAISHRINGFKEYMAENAPALVLTDTYFNGDSVENAQSNAENIISTYGERLIGMYSTNNITGDGVCLAVQSAGIGARTVSVAADSDDTEIAALRSGNLDALVVQDAYVQGYKGMENAILTLINGKNPETVKQIDCPPSIVTPENMDEEEMLNLLDPTRLAR